MGKEFTDKELDQEIMEAIGDKQYKVARILVVVRDKTNLDLEEIFQRLCDLIEDGILEGFGDINRWRHSEVRKK
jgi:hypothetical protein